MRHECPKTTALYTQLSHYTKRDTDRRFKGLIAKLHVQWVNEMTVNLQSIIEHYRPRLVEQYGADLTSNQWSALNALEGCRTGQYGDITWACHSCEHWQQTPNSRGHRLCNQCQHHSTQDWLERQQR